MYRPSQTPAYWTNEFRLTSEDIELLQGYVLQHEKPILTRELAKALIDSRFRSEEQRIRRLLSRGTVYRPKDEHALDQVLVFPGFDFAVGTVIGKRPGRNPEHGDFEVITVQIEGAAKPRLFASSLHTPHKLNRLDGSQEVDQGEVLKPDHIYETFGSVIGTQLAEQLARVKEPAFVHLGSHWLLASLLAEIHVGHLNIAEALIEVQNVPLPTSKILPELDLPKEISRPLLAFSLDWSLSQDARFMDVGVDSREWYLQRLLPEEATAIPRRLQHYDDPFDRSQLSVGLLELEWELDDEWTEGGVSSTSMSQAPRITVTLIYPHRRSGTLPLTNRTRSFFPVREGKRSGITFVDGRWGQRFPGWVMPDGRYVCGLADWYENHKLPVGAHVTLERTNDPTEVVIDFKPHRMKREWVRMARVENNQLAFQLQKKEIACDYDENIVFAEADPIAIDELRRATYRRNPSINELLEQLAPGLMGLSTQGSVHVATLYSAINLLRRTAPGPVFVALTSSPRFRDLGGGLFALAR